MIKPSATRQIHIYAAILTGLLFTFVPTNTGAGEITWTTKALKRTTGSTLGLPILKHPDENTPNREKIALGRKLFFDRRLSLNRTMSCAMCHIPEQGFTNWELQTSVGLEGRSGRRNAPTIVNVGYYKSFFVDGRESTLETQFISPLTAANEMANPSVGYVLELIKSLPDYNGTFEKIFGAPPSTDRLGMALASYQRSLIAANSPFDQWHYGGNKNALTAQEKAGFELFTGKAGCVSCHIIDEQSSLFTDNMYHDIGYGWWREDLRQHPLAFQMVEVAPGVKYQTPRSTFEAVGEVMKSDLGRYEVTQNPADTWKFRTPSLRNVELTRPYMHDGGFATLREVINFYNDGGKPHKGQDERIVPLGLTQIEIENLESFLKSLTSPNFETLISEARSSAPDNW